MTATERITPDALEALICAALVAAGTDPHNAASVARALTTAEVDGQKGHGLSRLASYVAQVQAGKIDGKAEPRVRTSRPGTLIIDAANGFAFPAFDVALDALAPAAQQNGIAVASIYRSHHAGALGLVAERLSMQGLVALCFANTPSAMAAWGGSKGHLGTNPIAFAAPRAGGKPIIVDLALSVVARGKIMAAAQKGDPIPVGWALDKRGLPTTNAKAALEGTLLPLGGTKGAALALMVELLAAGLTGGRFASEASSFLDDQGPAPATGQLLIAIDPSATEPNGHALERIGILAGMMESEPDVRLPGRRRWVLRERARASGIEVDAAMLEQARQLTNE
ncbi:MAG: Ldh family oxidoreductase [Hyphomicrobiaceae bacterium]